MMLEAEQKGEALVVRVLADRIDAAVAAEFKERMRDLGGGSGDRVIVDLSRVDFLDSSGLGAMVAVMKLLAPERRLELAGLTPGVLKLFRLTRMDGVFILHPTVPTDPQDVV
jgi:anti-sigma B factor antagonist